MTELQFKNYMATIVGKRISQTVTVSNVDRNGNVTLSGAWNDFSILEWWEFCVVVRNVPTKLAETLSGGEEISMTAVINGIAENNSFYYNCESTLLLGYLE